MCSFELQFPAPVNLVTFHAKPLSTNALAALTADGCLHISGQGVKVKKNDKTKPLSFLHVHYSMVYFSGHIHALC